MKNAIDCEKISVMALFSFFLQKGAIGKKIILNLGYPFPEKKEFVVNGIAVENTGVINEECSVTDFDSSGIIDVLTMENDCGESVVFYSLENCFYFVDREEGFCEKCCANGSVGGGCPFHSDMMRYHCPCEISLEEEGTFIVESSLAEVRGI